MHFYWVTVYKALHNESPAQSLSLLQHSRLTSDYSSHTQNKQKRWWPFICSYSTKIMEFIAWSHSCCHHHWTIQKTVEISLVQLIVLLLLFLHVHLVVLCCMSLIVLFVCTLHPWERRFTNVSLLLLLLLLLLLYFLIKKQCLSKNLLFDLINTVYWLINENHSLSKLCFLIW